MSGMCCATKLYPQCSSYLPVERGPHFIVYAGLGPVTSLLSLLGSWDSMPRPLRPLGLYFSFHASVLCIHLRVSPPPRCQCLTPCFSSEGWWGDGWDTEWGERAKWNKAEELLLSSTGCGPQGRREEEWWSPVWLRVHRPGNLPPVLETLLGQVTRFWVSAWSGDRSNLKCLFSRPHAAHPTRPLTSGFPHWQRDRDALWTPFKDGCSGLPHFSPSFSLSLSSSWPGRLPSSHSIIPFLVRGRYSSWLLFLQFNSFFFYKMFYCVLSA